MAAHESNYQATFTWEYPHPADNTVLSEMFGGSYVEDVSVDPDGTEASRITLEFSNTDIQTNTGSAHTAKAVFRGAKIGGENATTSSLEGGRQQVELVEYEDGGFIFHFHDEVPPLSIIAEGLSVEVMADD